MGIPISVVVVLFVLLTAAFSAAVLYLFRNSVRFEIRTGHNDIAGLIFQAVGVVYAVVMAFVVFAVWERYSAREDSVSNEASMLVAAYRDTQYFPEPQKTEARKEYRAYVEAVMRNEWRSHGKLLPHTAPDLLNPLWATYSEVTPRDPLGAARMEQASADLHLVEVARHQRHLSTETSLPLVFWFVLLLGAMLTIGFSFIFFMEHLRVHAILTSALTALIVSVLVLIFVLNKPFTGIVQVSKSPMEHALLMFDAIDMGVPPASAP